LYGKLIVKTVMKGKYPPITAPIPFERLELPHFTPIYQLEDSVAPNRNTPPPDPQPTRPSTRRIQGEPIQRPSRGRSLP
jgi:hypothetical protein